MQTWAQFTEAGSIQNQCFWIDPKVHPSNQRLSLNFWIDPKPPIQLLWTGPWASVKCFSEMCAYGSYTLCMKLVRLFYMHWNSVRFKYLFVVYCYWWIWYPGLKNKLDWNSYCPVNMPLYLSARRILARCFYHRPSTGA